MILFYNYLEDHRKGKSLPILELMEELVEKVRE